MYHPMQTPPINSQPQACFICSAKFMPNFQTLWCSQCQTSLCLSCVLTYTPETAFPMHLVCYGEEDTLRCYRANKSCATTLYRDPCMATVYYEYQRFYNTDQYINLLEERVSNIDNEVRCLSAELNSTQGRLSSAKYELLCAKQKKRRMPTLVEETHTEGIENWAEDRPSVAVKNHF